MAQTTTGSSQASPPDPGPRSLDASMTLLREVMERPLDPGYAVAARRRAEGATPTRRVDDRRVGVRPAPRGRKECGVPGLGEAVNMYLSSLDTGFLG